jgi:hypothetical protein
MPRVALRIPPAAFVIQGDSSAAVHIAYVQRTPAGISINGHVDWAGVGLAPLGTYAAGEILEPGSDRVTLRLTDEFQEQWLLSVASADTAVVVHQLLAPAADSVAVRDSTSAAVQHRLFTGPLAAVSVAAQHAIMTVVASHLGRDPLTVATVEGRPYLILPTTESTYTCTVGAATDAERQGEALREVAFPLLWNLGAAMDSVGGASFGFGVQVHMRQDYSCARQGSHNDLAIYTPAIDARRYAAGQLAELPLIHASIVMWNDRPVTVTLDHP